MLNETVFQWNINSVHWRQFLLSRSKVKVKGQSRMSTKSNRFYIVHHNTYFYEECVIWWYDIQKLLLIDPFMCVAVVALSLAILLLCFITFIVFYRPQLRLSTPNKVYDDDDDDDELSVINLWSLIFQFTRTDRDTHRHTDRQTSLKQYLLSQRGCKARGYASFWGAWTFIR